MNKTKKISIVIIALTLILFFINRKFYKVFDASITEKPNTQIEYHFKKNFPLYEIQDDVLFEEIEKSIAIQNNYDSSTAKSNIAGSWARIYVYPSSNDKIDRRFRLDIAGEYFPVSEEDLDVKVGHTQISVEKIDGKVIKTFEIGNTSNPAYLGNLFNILNTTSGVPIPDSSSNIMIAAPNTISMFQVHDDLIYQYLNNYGINKIAEISDELIVATFYIDKTNYIRQSNEYFKVELLADAENANLYKIKKIGDKTTEIISVGKIKFDFWQKLYDEHNLTQ